MICLDRIVRVLLHDVQRRGQLTFTTAGMRSRDDATLEMAAQSGWALHELPPRHVTRTDGEAAGAAAALAARLLTRRAVRTCERYPGGQPLGPATSPSASPIATRPTRSARPSP